MSFFVTRPSASADPQASFSQRPELPHWRSRPFTFLLAGLLLFASCVGGAAAEHWPGQHWETASPAEVGLDSAALAELRDLVGGDGCVVREGRMVFTWGKPDRSRDMASAFKPLLSTLLFVAIQEKRLHNPDRPVADFEPRLRGLNQGKDAGITWRQLASQTSGYGLSETPGTAWAYNDFALALYYDTLMAKVFAADGTEVLRTRLAEPLQFEDDYTFNAFHRAERDGRLALSVRDFARFGLMIMRQGRWRDRTLLEPRHIQAMWTSRVPPGLPVTSGREAEMIPGQRTVGGTRNITAVGPGFYSFNWWCNGQDASGARLFADAPSDTVVASGHGGKRMLWLIPSWDLVVCWNETRVEDHDASPRRPDALCNRAARCLRAAVTVPRPAPFKP